MLEAPEAHMATWEPTVDVIVYWDWGIVVAGMEADHEQGAWMVL
jgi:hypothetical protein